jgi:hypothetical protein
MFIEDKGARGSCAYVFSSSLAIISVKWVSRPSRVLSSKLSMFQLTERSVSSRREGGPGPGVRYVLGSSLRPLVCVNHAEDMTQSDDVNENSSSAQEHDYSHTSKFVDTYPNFGILFRYVFFKDFYAPQEQSFSLNIFSISLSRREGISCSMRLN